MSKEIEETEVTPLDLIHQEALLEYDEIYSACQDEREQAANDRRFASIPGAQYEGALDDVFENKPKIEVNKTQVAVNRLFSEYRKNPITVDFKSKEGKEYDKLADLCDGLYRADEQDSVAQEAYDNAFEEAVTGGIGAWRLRADYEDDEDEDDDRQRIWIEPIFDADTSVYFDLNAKRQDKADATSCYVLTSMTQRSFMATWDEDPVSWPKDEQDNNVFDWNPVNVVYVAEYYKVEIKVETVSIWQDIAGEEKRYTDADFEDTGLKSDLKALGSKEVRKKKIKTKKVHKYILSGGGILEDCGYIAGTCIPIVITYGKRWFIDNIERVMGHVRLVKDVQRLKNMQMSSLAEISALSTVEKPIFTPEQVGRHAQMWADDNIKKYPYLLTDSITGIDGNPMPAGPLAYTKVPQIPPAMAALLQIVEQDMQDLLGNKQAGEQITSNIAEGTLSKVQNSLSMQDYLYMSNQAKGMKRSGEIWLSMARDLYIEEGRKMKALTKDGSASVIEIGGKVISEESSDVVPENDLSEAKFDVISTVGPASDSKREALIESLADVARVTQDQETQQILGYLIMMNLEGEGISDANAFFRKKLVQMGAVQPTEEEEKEIAVQQQALANQPPDANTQFLLASAKEADANSKESNSKTVVNLATAEKTSAQTQEILAGIDMDRLQQALTLLEEFNAQPAQEVVPEVVQAGQDTTQPIIE